jgi:hypothetical protein
VFSIFRGTSKKFIIFFKNFNNYAVRLFVFDFFGGTELLNRFFFFFFFVGSF